MDLRLLYNDQVYDLKVERDSDKITLIRGDKNHTFQFKQVGEHEFQLYCCNRIHRVTAVRSKNKIHVLTPNGSFVFELPASKDSDSASADQSDQSDKLKITAPMPGKVVKVLVKSGDKVQAKQKLLIVEAMKMENPLIARFDAEVKAVNCVEGELVDSEKVLIELAKIE